MPSSNYRAVIFDLNGVLIQRDWPEPEVTMLELVRSLRDNSIQTAILSNLGASGAQIIREQSWSQNFDTLGFSGEIGVGKPQSDSYQIVANELGCTLSECVFIDDIYDFVAAAQAIGMTGVHFRDEASLRNELTALNLLP